ncbi:MAG: hypothetical protein OI74_10745 [Gammaproteobacteria bacterium (ex Lamellibrachia satsuma)]|nr:MAG: AF1514 family protein [Gammaproteobacteria bacterium (ex Lamellibrachia satsuma)]RRS32599.1 MAG: hypothetical protein OI74_10745 [Gammaproteobacteria bacterium (ex Lamellibrachia satsuma)]RRS36744.1 MAG: hypothetical protein NV67_05210 [Gammaproteobacteria bacterium (ex Lamellibrachia satsuma)]
MQEKKINLGLSCQAPGAPDMSNIHLIEYITEKPLKDYLEAMKVADSLAAKRFSDFMLISWYDRDRDFESPQHSSECHQDSAVPGYVDYGIHHGARLKVDFERGRFVFFYMPVDL